jgi:serine/threonine protein kinase
MTEREIFLGALDRKGARERAAYLDAACAGRPALRRRVEALLRSHREAGDFLGVPALEQMASADQSLEFLGPAREPDALGRLDHYEVLEVVGRGATGVVLKARDTQLQRVVAVKVLAPRLAASASVRERFVREAQAAAAVRDDHVVAIHAVRGDGAAPYLVMEYIAGVTLERRIQQAGALRLTEALRIAAQTASGLAAAHAQGLVHRDVKPANILLEAPSPQPLAPAAGERGWGEGERVKLTDFGLAGAASAGRPGGGIAGTPAYMSPEQARGEPVDHRSDLFSLGSVLYALCTGGPPFPGDTTAEVLKAVGAAAPRPVRAVRPDVPAWLGDVIARLPPDRFASAAEVADLLSARLAALQAPPPAPAPASAPGAE